MLWSAYSQSQASKPCPRRQLLLFPTWAFCIMLLSNINPLAERCAPASQPTDDSTRAPSLALQLRTQAIALTPLQVVLNVGGSRFTTTITTLRNAPSPSLFAAMFSGRHKLKQDADGSIFIDRDGRHFADVLNYLRDGQVRSGAVGSG